MFWQQNSQNNKLNFKNLKKDPINKFLDIEIFDEKNIED